MGIEKVDAISLPIFGGDIDDGGDVTCWLVNRSSTADRVMTPERVRDTLGALTGKIFLQHPELLDVPPDEFQRRFWSAHVVAAVLPDGRHPPTVGHKSHWCMTCKKSAHSNTCSHEMEVLHILGLVDVVSMTKSLPNLRQKGRKKRLEQALYKQVLEQRIAEARQQTTADNSSPDCNLLETKRQILVLQGYQSSVPDLSPQQVHSLPSAQVSLGAGGKSLSLTLPGYSFTVVVL